MKQSFINLSKTILDSGMAYFDAMLGIVSRIRNDSYSIIAVSSATGVPHVGDTYGLDAVYCREVYQSRRTVAITEIDGVTGMQLHPLYDAIPCECYISAPITVDGKVWGTLNFTSFEKRDTPFSANDIDFIESQALRLSELLQMAV